MKMSLSMTSVICLLLLSGCTVGPDYQRPTMTMPLHYKEARGWRQAAPQDSVGKGEWWAVYRDPQLDSLLRQVSISNQNVANYTALYRQAQALAAGSRADLFPTLGYDASSTRSGSRSSGQRTTGNTHQAELSASWELDLWGKLRRTLEENRASAEASAAELANITLSAQSELAQDYFQLRVINNKYQAGSESRATLAQAQMQLEHAIALLIGRAPAQFSLPAAKLTATLPAIPQALPAQLLQRRPDIAEAERNVAAANAAVGVAIAGYYPDLTLSASGGVSSSALHNLLSLPNRVWSLGPSLSGTVLDFGATSAEVEQARAAYDAKVASYRQTVLEALQEVENYLVELNTLQGEVASQQRATVAAQESARITRNQYDAGMIDYLDVATTENSRLSEQQNLLALQSTQWVASVKLIVALGGSWG